MSRALDLFGRLFRFLDRAISLVVTFVEAVAFWSSVALPVVYLGGYLGIHLLQELSLPSIQMLGVLLLVNFLALIVGNGYNRPSQSSGNRSLPTSSGRPQYAD